MYYIFHCFIKVPIRFELIALKLELKLKFLFKPKIFSTDSFFICLIVNSS